MPTTGLRELRQQASDLVRQAEGGDIITVTINGRPVAQLGPVRRNQWRRGTDLDGIFRGPADVEWETDRELVDDALGEPSDR
ncbi:MAG: type II toxin-antitoxin system Phd/YefM family antitoxin [Jatrophihabitans sp.]|uniref:type II toxin-antitoxin system Phd/YefM family antitoxin n=1 Tax=Jatrophihabitans sp. TaxID=1932789 RepID=UPI003F804F2B